MLRGESVVNHRTRQCRTFQLDQRDIDTTCRISPLAPQALAVTIQRHGEAAGTRHIVPIGVQLDFEPIREMPARRIQHDMPAGHQEQALAPREKEATGIGQQAWSSIGTDTHRA
ncbi:hypothetical protein D3C84_634830 [compost metagenome]